jgi:hypothetical protein
MLMQIQTRTKETCFCPFTGTRGGTSQQYKRCVVTEYKYNGGQSYPAVSAKRFLFVWKFSTAVAKNNHSV